MTSNANPRPTALNASHDESGTIGAGHDHGTWSAASLNSLPYEPKALKRLINKTVTESEENARMQLNPNKSVTANNKPIAWPPTRDSLGLLFKALNLNVAPTRLLDALIFSRGPKMEDESPENFSIDKLI